jgi:hypothetical protein
MFFGIPETQLAEAAGIAERTRREVAAKFRKLVPSQKCGIFSAPLANSSHPKPVRKHSKEISAAYAGWRAGMAGLGTRTRKYNPQIGGAENLGQWMNAVMSM